MTDVTLELQSNYEYKFNVRNHNGAIIGIITYDTSHQACWFNQKLTDVSAYQLGKIIKHMEEIEKKLG